MLSLLLQVSKFIIHEPCSVQREIQNRILNKGSSWHISHSELLEIHDTIRGVVKKRTEGVALNPQKFLLLIRNPLSTLNFIKGRTLSVNELDKFRRDFARTKI